MTKAKKRAVVIIPTYNELGNVERAITVLYENVFGKVDKRFEMSVLVVDDSSPDGTSDAVRKLKKEYKTMELLVNKRKEGLGNAYIKGMRYAIDKMKADVVVQFDADLSHDPEKIPEMLDRIISGSDMVVGSRYIAGGGIPQNWGLHRKFLSVVGNFVIRVIITDFSIHDWTGGFRATKASVVNKVLPTMTNETFMGYTFQIGFLHKASRLKYKISEVPFHFKDRVLGKSKLGAEYLINILYYLIGVRIKELLKWRIFKFAVVGGFGALVQLTSLQLLRTILPYQVAFFSAIELAVLSNFIWSNLWTFSDRKLSIAQVPMKFVQFNLASAGSIIIQQILAFVGEKFIGLFVLFEIFGVEIDTGLMYAVVGIFVGMFWNFFAYSKIIWRKK